MLTNGEYAITNEAYNGIEMEGKIWTLIRDKEAEERTVILGKRGTFSYTFGSKEAEQSCVWKILTTIGHMQLARVNEIRS